MAAGGWGADNVELQLVGTEFQFCKMKRVLEMDSGNTTVSLYLMPLNCTLRNV